MPQALDPTTQHWMDRAVQALKDYREMVLHVWPTGSEHREAAEAFARGVESLLAERGIKLTPTEPSAKEPTP